MRIVIAVHTYYPDKNGVQMVTQYLAEGLAKNNEVFLITQNKEQLPEEEKVNGVCIRRIKVLKKGYLFLGEKKKFFQYINDWNPDVLICVCTQTWTFDWMAKKLECLPGKKVLYTHGYSGLLEKYPLIADFFHFRWRALVYHSYWKRYYDKAYAYIRKFDLVTYLSENNNAAQYAEKYGLTNGIIMENAVDGHFFELPDETYSSINNREKMLVFLYVANYDDNKNHRMVLQAFLDADMKNAGLIFAGKGEREYYEKLLLLKEKAERISGKKNITLFYGQSRDETLELYDRADVFVCGSRKEQFPLMLCEAAAKGMAIISTDVGHASAMPGIILVKTEEEMASAMKEFNENPEEIGQHGMKLRQYAIEHYRRQEKIEYFEKELKHLYSAGK